MSRKPNHSVAIERLENRTLLTAAEGAAAPKEKKEKKAKPAAKAKK